MPNEQTTTAEDRLKHYHDRELLREQREDADYELRKKINEAHLENNLQAIRANKAIEQAQAVHNALMKADHDQREQHLKDWKTHAEASLAVGKQQNEILTNIAENLFQLTELLRNRS